MCRPKRVYMVFGPTGIYLACFGLVLGMVSEETTEAYEGK